MFTNVLIGIDGREGGHDAIALARMLASPNATVTLAHVCPPWLGRGAVEAVAIERTQAHSLLEHERQLASVDAGLAVKAPRPVGRGLHELAEEEGADLLVIGSSRHKLLGRLLIGDDTRASLAEASCAIAIAPPGYSAVSHRLRHLGVGYDGSAEGEFALSAARELASLNAAEITLLWVISPLDVRDDKPIPADWPEATDDLMDRHAKQLAQLEGVEGIVTSGGPREALTRFGGDLDLLIVGSHHHGSIDRLVHGSIPDYLARHATCPILVMPPEGAPAIAPVRETDAVAMAS